MEHPLRTIRKRFNLSQTDMAVMADTFQPNISQIELGKADVLPEVLDTIEKIGYDKKEFLRAHGVYHKMRKAQLFAKVKGGNNEGNNP